MAIYAVYAAQPSYLNYHILKNNGKVKERKGGQEGGKCRSIEQGKRGFIMYKGAGGERT